MPFFARLAFFFFARSLMPRLGKMLIPPAALAALGYQNALARLFQIRQQLAIRRCR